MATSGVVLSALGFVDVRGFQAAWNLGERLIVDGIWGPKTAAAGDITMARHAKGFGDLSEHFSAAEFRCKCGGKYPGCKNVIVRRELLRALETYRTHIRRSVTIVSGYRCPTHNERVGGTQDSQHIYGNAADIPEYRPIEDVKALGIFSGIGYMRTTGRVVHVDVRHIGGHNVTNSNLRHPAVWTY